MFNVDDLMGWSEVADVRAQLEQAADTAFRKLMRDKYGIAQTMADDDEDLL